VTRLARAFVAVAPPDAVLDALDTRLRALIDDTTPLRWLPRQQWHLTLAFLGGVDDADGLTGSLAAAARAFAPVALQLGGGGAFPRPRRASVLWAGVAAGGAELTALATTVAAASEGFGRHTEDRPYHPHLTVARGARPRPLDGLVDALGPDPIGPPWTAREVRLVESDTRPDGAIHTVRARLPLEGA
jgi:RNA 2',3'-cyclic 3'-phosphodiesterase